MDLVDTLYFTDYPEIAEKIIQIVAKDSLTNTIKQRIRLNKEVAACHRKGNELISPFIARFVKPAQEYINFTNADRSSQERQNVSAGLIATESLAAETFTSVMSTMVPDTKDQQANTLTQISFPPILVNGVAQMFTQILSADGTKVFRSFTE